MLLQRCFCENSPQGGCIYTFPMLFQTTNNLYQPYHLNLLKLSERKKNDLFI